MKASTIVTLFTSALCFQTSSAFVDMDIPAPSLPVVPAIIAPEAVFGDAISSFAESPIGSSTLGLANAFALPAQAAVSTMSSPEVESEFLDALSDFALDFSGIFRPTKKAMQLYSLGGRLMALMSDYLPDHTIHTEDLLIHLFFMGMTVKEMLEDEELQFVF